MVLMIKQNVAKVLNKKCLWHGFGNCHPDSNNGKTKKTFF